MKKSIILVSVVFLLIISGCSYEPNKTISVTPVASKPQVTAPEPAVDTAGKETKLEIGKLLEGVIEGAKYKVHVPEKWNGKLLIYAHGLVQAHKPLEVTLITDSPDHIRMIEEGWIIAATSYRRNGFILGDAFEDIDNLREFIESKYGEAKIAIVQGYSMGGLIAARMSECDYNYDGFLAIGAVYDVSVKYTPKKPILFLSNQDELEFPMQYCRNLKEDSVKPAVWKVSRDGHCNVNGKEVSACIDALLNWIEKDEIIYEKDITMEYDLDSIAVFDGKGAKAKITAVDEPNYNIDTEFIKKDLEKLNIKNGEYFNLIFNGDNVIKVLYGKAYTDVGFGEWVAYLNANGYVRIARNFQSIVKYTDCKVGDYVYITK